MVKHLITLIVLLALTGCVTTFVVSERDSDSGYFPTQKSATIVKSESVDLDARKELIVLGSSDFMQGQIENIGYFDEILSVPDLETRIVQEGLSERIPNVRDRIGLNNAAKHYKPFLMLRANTRTEGRQKYAQFILTDALTLDDYFITETHLDTLWAGVSDRNNWYPMFNALIDYIEANSSTYTR